MTTTILNTAASRTQANSPRAMLAAAIAIATIVLTAPVVAAAESATGVGYYQLGRAATAEQIAGWDIDVRPDGQGLPPGEGSVEQGDELFQEQCAQCHGVFGEGEGRWPVLVGGDDSLTEDRPEKTIGSYWPYATTVWDYIHRAMPFYNPQSLSDDEVYALTAYLLNLNGIVDDDFIADQRNLAQVQMPNRDGFSADPRPEMLASRCMADCKDPATIEITWDASTLGVTPIDHLANTTSGDTQSPAPAKEAAAAGQTVYNKACAACHANGLAGAPATGDKSAWLGRTAQGLTTLIEHAINGYHGQAGYMPPRGGQAQLSDDEVTAAVEFMVEQSKTKGEAL